LEVEAARELSLEWKLAHDLVAHIFSGFTFDTVVPSFPSDAKVPTTFSEAANVGTSCSLHDLLIRRTSQITLVTMAVSMHWYLSEAAH
jgi:hypothetical protein